MSALAALAADQRRRELMSPLGKCCLDDLTLITVMAYNDCETFAFAVFLQQPERISQFGFGILSLLRTVKAFANFRLAAMESGLDSCVDAIDGFDWINLRYLQVAHQPEDDDDEQYRP